MSYIEQSTTLVQDANLRELPKLTEKQKQLTPGIPLVSAPRADEAGESDPPYSVFTTSQKRWSIFMAASAGWFSTASSFIYFPAIPFLAHDLHVSIEKVNLTVTSYLIASGIFPSIVGSAADRYGRRPVFLASLSIYLAANAGLAVQRSFPALFVLRMVQSVAISGRFLHVIPCCWPGAYVN